jgi:hypothetical protein
LRGLKNTTENELGLKGITTSDDHGIKGVVEMSTGDVGPKGIGDSMSPLLVESADSVQAVL